MEPEADPQHKGYQLIQSLVAVGSGGIFGKGTTPGEVASYLVHALLPPSVGSGRDTQTRTRERKSA
jgi:hypothetical protein